MRYSAYFLLIALLFISCGSSPKGGTSQPEQQPKEAVVTQPAVVEPAVIVPAFDADSAYSFISKQVAFGPRVPGTATHRRCGDYLVAKLKGYGADVVTLDVELKAYNGDRLKARNIIAQFQPEKQQRVMLFAHWDTRPWADSDPDKANHYRPIDGANDGGSGVGVLLEIARQLSMVPTAVGVDIIFFDAEDYGLHENDIAKYSGTSNSWALGSQYWSRFPHKAGYSPMYGILLDIVGAPASRFCREYYSMKFAPGLVNRVWDWASRIGYEDYFVDDEGGAITDDHYYVNLIGGIPCINIINCDPESPNGFGPHHHTLKDNMSWIDTNTLKAVGQTVLTVIYNEK